MSQEDVREFYDTNAAEFAAKSGSPSNWYEREVNLPSLLRLAGEPAGNVLDFGCAAGAYTELIPCAHGQRVGSDLSPKLIEMARKSYPDAEFYVWDGIEPPPFATKFSCIFSKLVLNYVEDLDAVARNWHSILDVGGNAVVSVPNPIDTAKTVGQYSAEQSYTAELRTFKMQAPLIHRSFSGYLQPFLDAGFQLDAVDEPIVSVEQASKLNPEGRGLDWPIRLNFRLIKP